MESILASQKLFHSYEVRKEQRRRRRRRGQRGFRGEKGTKGEKGDEGDIGQCEISCKNMLGNMDNLFETSDKLFEVDSVLLKGVKREDADEDILSIIRLF